MDRAGRACLLAVLLLPLTACSPAPAVQLPKVEVAMYSGRPDPSFTLTREQADALSACRGTGTALPSGTLPDGLGFRYFDVSGLEADPLLVGVDGAWLDKGGKPTPVALCPEGFSILRAAAVAALGSAEAAAIPEA
jgi:hypothetical protein